MLTGQGNACEQKDLLHRLRRLNNNTRARQFFRLAGASTRKTPQAWRCNRSIVLGAPMSVDENRIAIGIYEISWTKLAQIGREARYD